MATTKPRKRPCSICRRWFLPDVRQKGRQTTCSTKCRKERHRRQCQAWNKKNKPYFKEIYLNQKLEQTRKPPPEKTDPAKSKKIHDPPKSRIKLHIPHDAIQNDISIRQLIIAQYVIEQLVGRLRPNGHFT